MFSFLKRTKRVACPFNAVAEGTFYDEPSKSYFKLMELKVPNKTTLLSEGSEINAYNYRLYGTTDFKNIQRIDNIDKDLITIVESLKFGKSVVLPSTPVPILSYIRNVCLKDGRIFIDKNISGTDNYFWSNLDWIVNMSGQFFDSTETHQIYRKNLHNYEEYWQAISTLLGGSEERWKKVTEFWERYAERLRNLLPF